MSYNPPATEDIIARLKTYVQSELNELNPTDQNNVLYAMLVAMANLSNDNNLQIKLDVIPNSFPQTCKSEEAVQNFASMKNTDRNQESASSGFATIVGTVGVPIPQGTKFLANDFKYNVISNAEISEDTVDVASVACNGTMVTVITTNKHNFASGLSVTMAGITETSMNGGFVVNVVDGYKFTYSIPASITHTQTTGITASANIAVLNLGCMSTGSATNLYNGDSLAIEEEIIGLSANAFVQYSNISGGSDIEPLLDWKSRVVNRFRNPVTYFNSNNIKNELTKIAGITKVWVYETTPEVGQCEIYFIRGNDTNIIPDVNEVQKAKDKLTSMKNVKDSESDVFVYAPTPVVTDFTFSSITPSTATMKTAIKTSLAQFFSDNVELSTDILQKAYDTAISNTFDLSTGRKLTDYTLSSPSTDIEVAHGSLATLGTVTFL